MTSVPAGWSFTGEPPSLGSAGGTVTLVEGATFCVCDRAGDISPALPHGLFVRDTRLLSRWQLLVDGQVPEPLAAMEVEPFATTFVARAQPRPGGRESTLLVLRQRYVGDGLREDVVLRNLAAESAVCQVSIHAGADFADLFEVKEGRVQAQGEHSLVAGDDGLRFDRALGEDRRGARISADGWTATPDGTLTIDVVVPARGEWTSTLMVLPSFDGVETPPRYPLGEPVERSVPAQRLREWREGAPVVRTDSPALAQALARTEQDLGALRIFDPEQPDRVAVAAGAPWFMTVFGRDSLLTAWMALLVDPRLAVGTLRTLARFQGTEVDARSEQEPGKILHEMRFGADSAQSLGGGSVYYGSVDATPLFVQLLGELHDWGTAPADVAELLPAADRALDWMVDHGDRDGDGFLEYERATDTGLVNQGWKDSYDGVTFADGRIADAPIALAEVQGYAYAAYRARARIARHAGDGATARRWTERAAGLRAAFNQTFWLPERGWFALGLDRDKRPIDSLASNMGHCLWTGIVDEDKAAQVADHLLSPAMFTGWGVRTLASTMSAYNPVSYHNGSVWPHDNALIAAGLMRYGFVEHAQRIAGALLEAAAFFDGRLPELFCGFERSEFAEPIAYPTSCSPQAWAAGTPLLLLRTLLRFDPSVPDGRLSVDPELPAALGELAIDGIPLGGTRIGLTVSGGSARVTGLPAGVQLAPSGTIHR
jgi:glycogen debranching enzyme